jgi:hypothetical protein
MNTDAERLLEDEERGWLEITETFGEVPQERFEEPTLNVEGWSPKDAMYHLGAWAEEAAAVLGRIAAGTHRGGDVDTDRLNAEWLEAGKDVEEDIVRLRFSKGRTAMRQAFAALDDVDEVAWEWFEESGPRHYAEHLPDLRAFLERGTAGP